MNLRPLSASRLRQGSEGRRSFFDLLTERCLPPHPREWDAETLRRARMGVKFTLALIFWGPIYTWIYHWLQIHIAAATVAVGTLMGLCALLILRYTGSVMLMANYVALALFLVLTILAYLTGGPTAPALMWYAAIPMIATALAGRRHGIAWALISAMTVIGIYALARAGYAFPTSLSPSSFDFLNLTAVLGLAMLVLSLAALYESSNQQALQKAAAATKALEKQATRDYLTALWNRPAILEILAQELCRSQREHLPLAVLLIDVDHYKAVNDLYGHQVGDAVLKEVAQRIRGSLRPYDAVGRYGGEEFLVVLPGCSAEGAQTYAQRTRRALAEEPVQVCGISASLTLSIGVCVIGVEQNDADADTIIRIADEALYRAKGMGRNRVNFPPPAPLAPAQPDLIASIVEPRPPQQ